MKKAARHTAVLAMILALVSCLPVCALTRGNDYLYDTQDRSVPAPAAYTAVEVVDGADMGVGALRSPQDVFVDREQNVYIADTDNNRIVLLDSQLKKTGVITQIVYKGETQELSGPKGVYKAVDGLLYICDTGNERVVAVNERGEAVRVMTSESIAAINTSIRFAPEKVVVDTDGNVYVVDPSIYQGIVQYNKDDAFIGFFAPNEVEATTDVLLMQLWKRWFSDQQVDAMQKALPSAYSNLYIDEENFLYASSPARSGGKQLKRLNTLGVDILQPEGKAYGLGKFGDLETSYEDYKEVTSAFVDVHADKSGILCGADSTRGRLFLYDADCSLIAVFGDTGDTRGAFRSLVAIDKLGDNYLALDSEKASLTVFAPTDYMRAVLDALSYYSAGRYVESVDLWEGVLQRNSGFTLAYRSIGRAYFQEGDNAAAMRMLKKGDDPYFYSMALKEYRKEFVRRYFVFLILGGAAVLNGLVFLLRRLRRWMLSGKER